MTPPPQDELQSLQERVRKLAVEKSYLQLIIELMNKVSAAQGLEDMIDSLLRNILDVLGGTNIILYYMIDSEFHYADIYSNRRVCKEIEDDQVNQVLESKKPLEVEGDFEATGLTTTKFTKAFTWVYPLISGRDLVGVVKLENLHIGMREIYDYLPTFFSYMASSLKNEIQSQTQLQKAYDQILKTNAELADEIVVRKKAEEELRQTQNLLEIRVQERTEALRISNNNLEHELEERQRIETALIHSQAELRTIYDHAPVMMCVIDSDRNILYANPAFANFIGYSENLLGNGKACGVFGCINARQDPRGCGYGTDCQNCKLKLAIEYTFQTGEGTENIEFHSTFVNNGSHREIYLLGSTAFIPTPEQPRLLLCLTDISPLKKAESALRESLTQLETAVQAGNVGLFDWDLATNQVRYSKEWKKQIGYEDHEIGNSFSEWDKRVHSEDKYLSLELVHHAIQSGKQVFNLEFRFLHKDGTYRWIYAQGSILRDENGKAYRVLGSHVDITERKKAQEEFVKEALRRHTLMDACLDGIAIINQQHEVVEANQRFADMLGYSLDEVIGLHTWDWEAIATEAEIRERFADLTKTKEIFETRHRRKDGSLYDVEVSASGAQVGNEPMVFTISRDITERKQALQTVKESEERYRILFEMANDMVLMHPFSTLEKPNPLVSVNDAVCRNLGYTRDELLKMSPIDLIWQPDMDEIQREAKVLIENRHLLFEKKLKTKNGGFIPVEIHAHLFDWHGQKLVLSIARDISERKRIQEELLRNQLLLNQTGQIAKVGGWELDLKTNKVSWTEQTYHIYELPLGQEPPLEEAINFYHPDDRGKLREALEQASLEGEPFDMELRFINAGGKQMWTRVVGIPQDVNRKVEKILGIFQDITEMKALEAERQKLQEQLSQAQKMESIGRLAGGVAHDFNNMLGVILGHTEMALESTTVDHPIHADLIEIQKAGQRSADLTRQLLAFARRQTVSPKVLDLNGTIFGMLKMLQRLIGEDINLFWYPGNDLWTVKMDPSQVDQILANLCVNARDAIEDTGEVIIETQNVSLQAGELSDLSNLVPGDYVEIKVKDTGCGMDRETLNHIFEPFFTTKGIGEGTGLGLSTVYGIVRQNNGYIHVASQPGKGTSFHIYIPRHVGKTEQNGSQDSAGGDAGGKETILLVEDDTSLLKLTTAMLTKLGYQVLAADNPVEAIRIAEEYPGNIQMLITDVIMPEMNGRDLARRIMTLYPDIKRIFMSGYTADVIAHHGVLDESVHFLHKPFTRKALANILREAFKENN